VPRTAVRTLTAVASVPDIDVAIEGHGAIYVAARSARHRSRGLAKMRTVNNIRTPRFLAACGPRIALPPGMCSGFATPIDRAGAAVVEMPGLELTRPQPARPWTAAGFPRWTTGRTVVRTGRDLVVADEQTQQPDVRLARPHDSDTSVWSD